MCELHYLVYVVFVIFWSTVSTVRIFHFLLFNSFQIMRICCKMNIFRIYTVKLLKGYHGNVSSFLTKLLNVIMCYFLSNKYKHFCDKMT